jgi:hypothetical protein
MAGTVVKIKQSAVAGRLPTHSAGSTYIEQGELALNTADQKLYSKDSSGTIFEIGSSAAAANEIVTTDFTATSSQTSFAVSYTYTTDHVNVYYNGVHLSATDFTATNGTSVVLGTGATTGDLITIEVIKALSLASGSDIDEHEFTATASQTSFTISGGYNGISSDVEVYVNGIKLRVADFTATSGTAVVLGTGATVNDEVTIRIIKVAVLTSVVNTSATTGSAIIPAGTTAQRDGSPSAGYLRWNSTLNRAEIYNDNTSAWQDVGQQTLTTEQVQDAIGPMLSGNTESGITVTYDDANNEIDFTVASQTDQNFTNTLKTKLDGIETSATADQTGAQIKTAYQAESNAFTDAQFTKLSNIETAATADQTGAQIKTLYQAESNAFTDAQFTKLSNIETAATADQTNAQIKTAYEANSDTNEFSDAEQSKLAAIEASADVTDVTNVTAAGALMDSELAGIAAVKATTGTFLTADQTKLDAIEASADVTDTTNVVAALTAGTNIAISGGGTVSSTDTNTTYTAGAGIVLTGTAFSAGPIALTTVQVAANQTAQLALTAEEGDVAVRSDEKKSYMHNGGSAGTMNDWTELQTPTDSVLSVNSQTGAITAAHIAAAVEAASDSNTFTDADHTKLNAIEASATADQTNAEIKAAVEAASDSNTFTDADHSKLNAIEASATTDQTAAEIRTLVGAATDSNVYTDALNTKLAAIEAAADVTDATNVNAAGALMLSDTTTAGLGIVVDEDNMASNSATKLSTQQAIKAYVDAQILAVPDAVAMAIALG